MIIEITVPDLNDSFSRIILDGKQRLIRFSWNDFARRWSFGLYSMQKEPIAIGLRMMPLFPLNLQIVDPEFPSGIFGVKTKLTAIERHDFVNKKAAFVYIPRAVIQEAS
jgi:hypothetical protein